MRRIWSLKTGRLLDECDVELVDDRLLHRELIEPQDIRVELTLKGAVKMYERAGADVCEVYSQPRVCQEASHYGLQPGWSLDLTMEDPETKRPWDLSKSDVQNRVRDLVRKTKPFCIIGSPPCTPFSPLQAISKKKRDPRTVKEELERGRRHVRFCVELYKMQLAEKGFFCA